MPQDMVPTVCLFISGCTPYAASTHHFITFMFSALRVSTKSFVPHRYLIAWISLPWPSSVGGFIRVQRYAMAVCKSGHPLIQKNSSFATILWNSSTFSSPSNVSPSRNSSKWGPAGVVAVPLYSSARPLRRRSFI